MSDGGKDELGSIWSIPIGITVGSRPSEIAHKLVMTKPTESFELDSADPNEWIKVLNL